MYIVSIRELHPGDEALVLGAAASLQLRLQGFFVLQQRPVGGEQLFPSEALERELDGPGEERLLARCEIQGVGELEAGKLDVEDRDYDAVALPHDRDAATHHPVDAGHPGQVAKGLPTGDPQVGPCAGSGVQPPEASLATLPDLATRWAAAARGCSLRLVATARAPGASSHPPPPRPPLRR